MAFAALRSVLFVPASRPDRFQKALGSGADAVIFDLEDAVEANRKVTAREDLGQFLRTVPPVPAAGAARFVRINAAGSAWFGDELEWLRDVAPFTDAVLLPKAERSLDLERVAACSAGRGVVPMLETSRGILNAPDLLAAGADIPAAVFGAEDLTAELGIPRTLGGEELLYARSRIVMSAALIGADAIDAVWVAIKDLDGLRRDATHARALGFRGKSIIHPDHVPIVNEVFSPTSDEVDRARRVIDADARARSAGAGAFRLNDEMVDAPVVKRARRVLAIAEQVRNRL